MNSTPLIAFDQHAATTVAAVVLPGQRTPALHSLPSETATILRFVKRVARNGAVQCCYEREDIRADLLRARHRLSKCLLRQGRRFTATKKAWSKRHETWRRAQTWAFPALDQTHRAYLRAVEETVARLRAVEEDLRALLTLEPLQTRVQRLRCFRGIDDLTALTMAAELGDARRFATAPRTMAFVGLIPSEHSSGAKQARGADRPIVERSILGGSMRYRLRSRTRAARARQLPTNHGHAGPTREYQSDSSSLPLGRSDDWVQTRTAPGWLVSRVRAHFANDR